MEDSLNLVLAAQAGDRSAVNELLERYLPRLRAFVRLNIDRELRARESSCDIVQSICLEVFDKLDRFEYRGEASFRNWLFAWALRKLKSKRRFHEQQKRDVRREVTLDPDNSQARLMDCYATFSTPSRHAMRNERIQQLEAAFDELPEKYRNIVVKSRTRALGYDPREDGCFAVEPNVEGLDHEVTRQPQSRHPFLSPGHPPGSGHLRPLPARGFRSVLRIRS